MRARWCSAFGMVVACAMAAVPNAGAHAMEVVRSDVALSAIANGGPRAVWVAEANVARIGRLDGAGRARWFTRGVEPVSPGALVSADDGGAWFAGQTRVGRIASDGHVVSHRLGGLSDSASIARGPRASAWFVRDDGVVGRLRGRHMTLFHTPASYGGGPIMRGPDGRMWFAAGDSSEDGFLYAIDEHGHVTKRLLPVRGSIAATASGRGRLYIALHAGPLLIFGPGSAVRTVRLGSIADPVAGLTVGPDRHLWVSAPRSDRLLRLTLEGAHVKSFRPGELADIGSDGLAPGPIVPGPRNSMWFLAYYSAELARVSLSARDCTVPDLIGAAAGGVARRTRGSGCTVRTGKHRAGWTVRSQVPAAGRVLSAGARVVARFGPPGALTCDFPRGSTILASSPQAEVATRVRRLAPSGDTEYQWWGCVDARIVLLSRDDDADSYEGIDTLVGFRVTGTFAVAISTETDHYGEGGGDLAVFNLRTGRRSMTPVIGYAEYVPNVTLDGYAVGPQGDLLWLLHANPPASDTTAILALRTPAGITTLATGTPGAISDLTVDGATARWSEHGQPHQYVFG